MTILVDTDILIDVALERQPHYQAAADLLGPLERRRAAGCIAWHSVANFHYLLRPARGTEAVKSFLLDLLRFIQVAPALTDSIRYAASLPMPDFEDALQAAAAVACGADRIATRNLRHYRRSPVPAAAPAEIVRELAD